VAEGTFAIHGYAGGSIEVMIDGRVSVPLSGEGVSRAPVAVLECPLVDYGGCRVRMQPHAFRLPGFDFAAPVARSDLAFQGRHAELVESALALVARHQPGTFAQLRDSLEIVALRERELGSTTNNISHSDLPFAIIASLNLSPYYLGDVLVHEFHHHRLFAIEEDGPFLDERVDDLESVARYCSPWREDARPLHGILHGLYVFIPTTRYWLAVWKAGEADRATMSLALDRVVRGRLQLEVALHQLGRYARFTAFGADVFECLRREVADLGDEIDALALPPDCPFMRCEEDGSIGSVPSPRDSGLLGGRAALVGHLRRTGLDEQVRDILESFPVLATAAAST
jgi:HEXXH motif-containing protein